MKNSIYRNKFNVLVILIYLFSIFLFIVFNYFLFSNSQKIIINLSLIIFLQIFTFFIFKIDIISSVSFLIFLVLIPSLDVYYRNASNLGDLTFNLSSIPINMYYITWYTFIFLITWSFIAYLFKINIFEQSKINKSLMPLNKKSIIFNNVIAVAFSVIALPSLPKFSFNINETPIGNGLLPGHAWNQLVIVALLFNLPYLYKHRSVMYTYIFVIIWFILHGERADLSGLFLGLVIFVSLSHRINKFLKIVVAILFVFISLFFISIKSHFTYNIMDSFIHLTTFSTVSDVSYIFNTSIQYIMNFGYMHGKMFLSLLESIIPSIGGFCNIGTLFNNLYMYPGGGSIVTTPLLDGGNLGIILYTIFYLFLIRFIVMRKSLLFRYELLILISSIPRISWYGTNYVFSSMLFFVPFIYFVDKYINNTDFI